MEDNTKVLTLQVAKQFVLGGQAYLTISNGQGEHYTYRFKKKDYPDRNRPGARFISYQVSVLTGQDNETNYTYIGTMNPQTFDIRISVEHSPFRNSTRSVRVLRWMLTHILKQEPFEGRSAGYTIKHEGKCGKCGRRLTTPESIDTGFGPDCAAELGIEWREAPASQLPLELPQ